ncbi:hypothetical protein, partial [Xanthomonas translucens]
DGSILRGVDTTSALPRIVDPVESCCQGELGAAARWDKSGTAALQNQFNTLVFIVVEGFFWRHKKARKIRAFQGFTLCPTP